jgi:signal transduction histidine kinase
MSLVSWLWRPIGKWRGIGRGDVALAAVLSLYAIGLVSGAVPTGYSHGGFVAAVAVLAMTLPVAWERRSPLAASAAVAAGAAANELLIGPMVRCGPALPAVFAIAFFAGTRLTGRKLFAATVFCLVAVTVQAFFDPRLGAGFLVAGLPVAAGFCLAGRLARSRAVAAAALRERNAELREQRERTARLAVAADRARVAADLDEFLGERITAMADAAAAGRQLISADPAGADDAFAAVQNVGRATLSQMRDVVGTLRQDALTEPQPVLAQLGSLLEHATSADARLHVAGSPRVLPAGVELCAYRIVEHLLGALEDEPEARIDVRLRFTPGALELDVSGTASQHADPAAAFAVARERAALLGGTLRVETGLGRCSALVRLPLAVGDACS